MEKHKSAQRLVLSGSGHVTPRGQLRAREGGPLAQLWLDGKLLYALMLEKRMRRKLGDRWGRLDQQRTTSWWRPWKMLAEEIALLNCARDVFLPISLAVVLEGATRTTSPKKVTTASLPAAGYTACTPNPVSQEGCLKC